MKKFIFSLFCFLSLMSFGQIQDCSFLLRVSNTYSLEYDTKYSYNINRGDFSILTMSVVQDTVFKSSYDVKSDTIYVKNLIGILKFKVKSDGILFALSDFYPYIKKGDKLYAKIYHLGEKVILFGGGWKNDLKEGNWILLDENGIFSKVLYKSGEITGVW